MYWWMVGFHQIQRWKNQKLFYTLVWLVLDWCFLFSSDKDGPLSIYKSVANWKLASVTALFKLAVNFEAASVDKGTKLEGLSLALK